MKYSLIVLALAIGTLVVSNRAYANPARGDAPKGDRNSANVLITEPVTITNQWDNIQTNNIQKTTNSILSIRDSKCKKINPLELIENPATFFRECPQPNQQNLPYTQPVEYLKVPKLDGGIKVPVSNF
ncbi:MAG: hypothetical protein QNJ63_12405 [Calothrix sp. MO_192.B10]|nr:hypothetical protein [Calothrix sp. MO_192.B10]